MEFKKIDNSYYLDNVKIPSVTQIIRILNKERFKYIDKDILDSATRFGTNVHQAIDDYDNDNYNWLIYTNNIDNYIEVYKSFIKDYNYVKNVNEISLYHPDLKFAGTVDKICYLNNIPTLLDIKTGQHYKEHYLQVAGYKILATVNNFQIEQLGLLYLTDSEYKLHIINKEEEREYTKTFYSLLDVYNFITKKRRIKYEQKKSI